MNPATPPAVAGNVQQVFVVSATKSVGVSILLTVLFGPLGMLYSTVVGAIIMVIASALAGVVTLGFGLLFMWPISIVWGAIATASHNRRMLARAVRRPGTAVDRNQAVQARAPAAQAIDPDLTTVAPATSPVQEVPPTTISLGQVVAVGAGLFCVVAAGLYFYRSARSSSDIVDSTTASETPVVEAPSSQSSSTDGFPRVNTSPGRGIYLMWRVNTDDAVKVSQAQEIIRRRLIELAVPNPSVSGNAGAWNQMSVSLPLGTDMTQVKEVISADGWFQIKLVEGGPTPDEKALLKPHGGRVPAGTEVVEGSGSHYLVRSEAVIANRDLRTAKPALDGLGQPAVSVTLNNDGIARFARATRENVGRYVAMIVGRTVLSAPVIEGPISPPEAMIQGIFTAQEAANLALILRSGALPASVTFLEERLVR